MSIALAFSAAVAAGMPRLENPGFETVGEDGSPAGWTILTGLDPNRYGPPDYEHTFNVVRPLVGDGGYHSTHCLAFPAEGTWFCPVFTQSQSAQNKVNGKPLGKAAAFQTVDVPAGRYRLSAWLRTAGGDLYSAAFSLGVNIGPAADYANDGSTGIQWTRHDLAMADSQIHGRRERGEWTRYETKDVEVNEAGQLTVWIRFNYVNENQFRARWQADDVALERIEAGPAAAEPHPPCPPPPSVRRFRTFPGERDEYLVDPGQSRIVEAPEIRLFRRAREIQPGDAVRYRLPCTAERPTGLIHVLVQAAGPASMRIGDLSFPAGGPDPRTPVTRTHPLPASMISGDHFEVAVTPAGEKPVRVYELEASGTSRTDIRLRYVEADPHGIPWRIGVWDAAGHEFAGDDWVTSDHHQVVAKQLRDTGLWRISFNHDATPGHRYFLIVGLIQGTARIDLADDGIIDWIATTEGEEIVDFDATDLLRPGANVVTIENTGRYDFAAMIETCPGSADTSQYQLAFGGNELAELITRAAEYNWFWLRELHYEPNGFIDASIPFGKWHNQFWPVDIAFALREWTRWGYHDEARRVGAFMADHGWKGHDSNRSGGIDNTAANILVRDLCEIIRRSDFDPDTVSGIYPTVQAWTVQTLGDLDASPVGLIRGTNWENAGNRKTGPCYALSTNLGAAFGLRKAADIAQHLGQTDKAGAWRDAADRIRRTVLDKLVLREPYRCPSGFVLPAGTWAYGLRTDGAIEDEPLAGYFWAGTAFTDFEGLSSPADAELFAVYNRTLDPAIGILRDGPRGSVCGYAASYDGPGDMLILAALADRVDEFELLLGELASDIDVDDVGTTRGELSRWVPGAAGWAEDTNLVCAAGFAHPVRILAGVDDLLYDGRQLSLIPRLPWSWDRLSVNGWRVRYRDAKGDERWTTLSFRLQRSRRTARMEIATAEAIRDVPVRVGPFNLRHNTATATIDGQPAPVRLVHSGHASWVQIECGTSPQHTVIEVAVQP